MYLLTKSTNVWVTSWLERLPRINMAVLQFSINLEALYSKALLAFWFLGLLQREINDKHSTEY